MQSPGEKAASGRFTMVPLPWCGSSMLDWSAG